MGWKSGAQIISESQTSTQTYTRSNILGLKKISLFCLAADGRSFYLRQCVCMSVCMYVNKWWWFLIEILPLILFILILSTQTNRIKPFEAQFPVQNYYVKSGFSIPKHVIISIALHSIRKKKKSNICSCLLCEFIQYSNILLTGYIRVQHTENVVWRFQTRTAHKLWSQMI